MFPNKLESILLVLSLFVVQLVSVAYLAVIGATWKAGDPVVYIIVSTFSVCIITWFSLGKMELKLEELFHSNQNSELSVITITVVPIVMVVIGFHLLVSNYFNFYYTFFPNETDATKNLTLMMNSGFLGFISVCLVAPVVEEVLFRGIILRGLLGNYNKASALLFSSVLFSLFHINPDQLFHTFVCGLFLGWLYIATFSLWTSVLAHILFNIVAYILGTSIVKIEGVSYFPNDEIVYPSIFVQVVSVALLYCGFIILKRTFSTNEN